MDDSLLDDDDPFKNEDGEDELDEDALLGLSEDEEILDINPNEDKILDDRSGRSSGVYQSNNDEDVLEVNVDTDLDSFAQDLDSSYGDEMPRKQASKDVKYKENLISITLVPSEVRNRSLASKSQSEYDDNDATRDSDLLDDEESDEDDLDGDRRGRFKSERSNIITLTPSSKRTTIPDSLESVLNSEERSKAQAFLENEKRKKMFQKSRSHGNFRNTSSRQNYSQNPRPAVPNAGPHKILVNPHFARNLQIASAHSISVANQPQQIPMVHHDVNSSHTYQQASYAPQEVPGTYGLGDMFVSAQPPVVNSSIYSEPNHYNAPPVHNPMVNVSHSLPVQQEYQQYTPVSTHISPIATNLQPTVNLHVATANQPISSTVWSQPPLTYTPVPQQQVSPNYAYSQIAAASVPNYNTSVPPPNYQTAPSYAPSVLPPSNPEQYQQNASWPPQNQTQVPAAANSTPTQNIPRQRIQIQRSSQYQFQQQPLAHQQQLQQQQQTPQRRQLLQRQQVKTTSQFQTKRLVKRAANFPFQTEPAKQQRLDDNLRKTTYPVRKVNTNIKQIPLVENVQFLRSKPTTLKQIVTTVVEEDEATRNLRMQIEEQKKLREEIMKRKEERRKQMAAQRISNIRNIQPAPKPNVKARVGVSTAQPTTQITNVKQAPFAVQKTQVQVQKAPEPKPQNNQVQKTQIVQKKVLSIHQRIGVKNKVQFPRPPLQNKNPLQQQNRGTQQAQQQNRRMQQPQQQNRRMQQPQQQNKPMQHQQRKPFIRPPFKRTPVTNQQGQKVVPRPAAKFLKKSPIRFKNNVRNSMTPPSPNRPNLPLNNMRFPPNNMRFPPPHNRPMLVEQQRMPFRVSNVPPNMNRPPPHPAWANGPPLLRPPEGIPRFEGRFEPPMMQNRMNFPPPNMGMRPERPPMFRMPPPFRHERPPPSMEMFPPRFDNPMVNMRQPPPPQNFSVPPPFMYSPPKPRLPPPMMFNNRSRSPNPRDLRMSLQRLGRPSFGRGQQAPRQQTPKVEKPNSTVDSKVGEPEKAAALEEKKVVVPVVKVEPPIKTKTVVVNNLSSSATELQLKKLATPIGPIEKIDLNKNDRKAIIKFKDENHAMKFQSKYQRFMLDLAMIEVSLLPS